MKRVQPILLTFVFAVLLCAGCAQPTWTPYVGAQQKWVTSPGAFTDTNRSLLVYYGYPPAEYIVLGQIGVGSQYEINEVISGAANEAKMRGADAIIMGPSKSFPVGGLLFTQPVGSPITGFGNQITSSMVQHDLSAVAIKWKNPTGNPTISSSKKAQPPTAKGKLISQAISGHKPVSQ